MALGKRTYFSDQNFSHQRYVTLDRTLPTLITVAIETLILYKTNDSCSVLNTNNFVKKLESLAPTVDRQQTTYLQNALVQLHSTQDIKLLDSLISDSRFIDYLNSIVSSIVFPGDTQILQIKKVCSFFNIDLMFIKNQNILRIKHKNGLKVFLFQDWNYSHFNYWKITLYGFVDIERFRQNSLQSQTVEMRSCGHFEECQCFKYTIEDKQNLKKLQLATTQQKCFVCDLYDGTVVLLGKTTCSKCLLRALYEPEVFYLFFGKHISEKERLVYRRDVLSSGENYFINRCLACMRFGLNICSCLCDDCYRKYNRNKDCCDYCNQEYKNSDGNFVFKNSKMRCQYCQNDTLRDRELISFKQLKFCKDCAYTTIRENGYYSMTYSKESFIELEENEKNNLLNQLLDLGLPIDKEFYVSQTKLSDRSCDYCKKKLLNNQRAIKIFFHFKVLCVDCVHKILNENGFYNEKFSNFYTLNDKNVAVLNRKLEELKFLSDSRSNTSKKELMGKNPNRKNVKKYQY